MPITYNNGVLCGPEGQSIVGYRATTGQRLWSIPLPDIPVSLFEPVEGKLVIATPNGYHWLVDTQSGELLYERLLESLEGGADRVHLEGDRLILGARKEVTEGHLWNLVAVDVSKDADEGVIWSRELIGTQAFSFRHLRLADGVIPMVCTIPTEFGGADARRPKDDRRAGDRSADDAKVHSYRDLRGSRYQTGLVLIDKATGEDVCPPIFPTLSTDKLTGHLEYWSGRLLLQTTSGIVAVDTKPLSSSGDLN